MTAVNDTLTLAVATVLSEHMESFRGLLSTVSGSLRRTRIRIDHVVWDEDKGVYQNHITITSSILVHTGVSVPHVPQENS